jgi:hypothetical protein
MRWNVYNLEIRTAQEFIGDARISVADNEAIRIVLKANAPGGIRLIRLDGEGQWTCHGDGVNQLRNALQNRDESSYTPAQAPAYTFLTRTTELGGWECNPGFGSPTGSFVFHGDSSNFTGQSTHTSLIVCNARGCA